MYVQGNKTDHKVWIFEKKLRIVFAVVLLAAIAYFIPKQVIAADASVTITEINYKDSTITIKANSADKVIYFSEGTKNVWEEVPGELNSSKEITMDISWVSVSKSFVLNFKGDSSSKPMSVTLPKQETKFKGTYRKLDGSMSFSNAGTSVIEWRKKDSTTWTEVGVVNDANLTKLKGQLESMVSNGATVIFRLQPINGTSKDNVGVRASKEVSVSIPKKSTAPSINIDGTKLSIAVKTGMQYRVFDEDKTAGAWTDCKKSEDLLLSVVAPEAMYQSGKTQEKVVLQFRTAATTSKQVSGITSVTVPIQEADPNKTTAGISLNYTSATTLALQVKAASSTTPYEYTIVDKGETLNYTKASWTAINSNAEVTIKEEKAKEGSHIYVRKKSLNKTGDEKFSIASKELDVSGSIQYPGKAGADQLFELKTIAGICNEDNVSGNLKFTLYSPTKTTVTAINFHDAFNSTSKGTVTFKSTVAENTASGKPDSQKYIITTEITSTKGIEAATGEVLYADITLENMDKIESTATNGVSIYIYPKSVLNNPTSDKEYTAAFDRVYLSNDPDDKSTFKFRLDFGMDKAVTTTRPTDATEISSITFGGYSLDSSAYSVTYSEAVKNGKNVRTANVTVNTKVFEDKVASKYRDEDEYLNIKLNNGEILDKLVSINLVSTATLEDTPISWSFTAGSLKETTTSTTTNPDGSTTTKTVDVNDHELDLLIFDNKYDVAVKDVTWGENGESIYHSASTSGGKIKIVLSNKKINKLTSNASITKNVIITFDNGYKITAGCKMTILKPVS